MAEHIEQESCVRFAEMTDRAARIADVLSGTHERWAEPARLLRNFVVHHGCGSGKTEAMLRALAVTDFERLRNVFEASLEDLTTDQDRESAAKEAAEILAVAVLTEMSSLGSPGARRMRNSISYADLARTMCGHDRVGEVTGRSRVAEVADVAELAAVNHASASEEPAWSGGQQIGRRAPHGPRATGAIVGITEAFERFHRSLEVTPAERRSASRCRETVRAQLDQSLDIDTVILGGSYARDTSVRPLRDLDVVVVLNDSSCLDRRPTEVLDNVRAALVPHYGDGRVTCGRRSVQIDLGAGDMVGEIDVVPAVRQGDLYLIPDALLARWTSTDPRGHAERVTVVNTACSNQWTSLVRMLKKWNDHQGKPVKPSFLIEVMALDILGRHWTDDRPNELRQFFTTAVDRIADCWPDPAGIGPAVSEDLHADPAALAAARNALRQGKAACAKAIRLQRAGRVEDAIQVLAGVVRASFRGLTGVWLAEIDLAAGWLCCPRCRGALRAWSHAARRRIRRLDAPDVRPRRARCTACGATQVLLPASCLPRRADATEVVGAAPLAKAREQGYRRIARDLHRPVSTVRRWLRRATAGTSRGCADAASTAPTSWTPRYSVTSTRNLRT